jgi:TPR repeat protein
MYEVGGGLENNVELSMKLFGIAARLGSVDAQLKLAETYDNDKNRYYDTKKSFKYYQMAADKDSPHAKYKLAIMYLDGRGTSQNLIQAYYLFKESSNLGYGNAIDIFNIPIDYSKTRNIDYEKVAAMFITVCNKNIDSLECNIGHLYTKGFKFIRGSTLYSFTENPKLKKAWYERAASKGIPLALYELGTSHENKSKKAQIKDFSEAIDYFQRAYTNGSSDAAYKLATMYLNGYGVSQNLGKAFTLLHEASDQGHKEAYEILNEFNVDHGEDTQGVIRKMLEISAESGHVISQYKLGILASDTKSFYYNIKGAIKWLGMASSGGFILAHYKLGLLLESDNHSEEGQQKIISLYRMAADKGYEHALFRLAQLYQNGTKRDYVEAFRLYTLAARQGYQPAQLATCVSSEPAWEEKKSKLPDNLVPGELEYPSCLQMWEAVAGQGNVELQYSLGMMYEEVGTDSSLSEAARWYSRAAECSHTLAIYHLGRLYETGRGVHQDYLQAIKYYKIARDLGNRDALYQLGIIYQHGKGTRPDTKKAIDYYTKAAEKGNTMAQFTLGQLFEKGELVSKSILEAVKWYSMSRSYGNDNAHNWLYNNYDQEYYSDAFYYRLYHILSQIVKINRSKNRRHNNEFLGEVNYRLGLMYLYGYVTKLDYKKALQCFRESTKLCDNDDARFFSGISYENISVSSTEEYLKKVTMFETAINQLDLEEIYELGLIFYHGINSISEDASTNETRIIIESDRVKSSKYFRMIVTGQILGKMGQK